MIEHTRERSLEIRGNAPVASTLARSASCDPVVVAMSEPGPFRHLTIRTWIRRTTRSLTAMMKAEGQALLEARQRGWRMQDGLSLTCLELAQNFEAMCDLITAEVHATADAAGLQMFDRVPRSSWLRHSGNGHQRPGPVRQCGCLRLCCARGLSVVRPARTWPS